MWPPVFCVFPLDVHLPPLISVLCPISGICVAGVSLSSDFIAGFCGETEADHQQTVSLIREVGYNTAFLFAYSLRQVRACSFYL